MLNNQKKFIEILNKINEISINCDIDNKDIEKLLILLENMPLIVPIVGDFSSGKSTLLNKFIGKDILEVNIKPETEVPAELYYSEEEYDIGIDKDNNQVKLDNVKSENIKDYLYIKRYIKSDNLKKIEPIILVDMPGFDSPLENHNRAIMSYLDKGIYYLALVPVDAGTVTKSMLTQIKNIVNFKKDFSIFITKTDLRSETTIREVSKEVKNRLEDIDINKDIAYINQNDIHLFDSMIKELDPEQLFYSVFYDNIDEVCYNTNLSINMKIAALEKDKKENDRAIKSLEDSLKRIEKRKANMIEEIKNNSYEKEANEIINQVGKELNNNIDSLVNIVLSGNPESLKDEVLNITQSVTIEKLGKVTDKLSSDINMQFSSDIRSLDKILSDYNIDEFSNKILNVIERFDIQSKSVQLVGYRDKTYKTLTTAFAVLTDIINPVIEILIIFLPEIINLCSTLIAKSQQKNEVRSQILSQIPSIKRKLRPHIIECLKKESEERINRVSQTLDEELNKKKNEIEEAQIQLSSDSNIEELIKDYEEKLDLVNEVHKKLYL
ncbi:dynamin family protein [Brachyspira sp.]|uniref:dynamin family protein n=1 Tax=Brachyspira sp. TaxID=1977261 RepID=UPI003D7D2517